MSPAMQTVGAEPCDLPVTAHASPLSASHGATSPHEKPHERRRGWHFEPTAEWMTPDVFLPGGAVELRTAQLQRAHGSRCLTMWRDSVNRFANGRAITAGVLEAHNRQTLDHWCFARAAALVLADARYGVRRDPEAIPERAAPTAHSKSAAQTFGWGGGKTRTIPWGRR
jgi:hypothetical protein